jgi:hypothetical protein
MSKSQQQALQHFIIFAVKEMINTIRFFTIILALLTVNGCNKYKSVKPELGKSKSNYSAAENYRNITLRAVMIFYSQHFIIFAYYIICLTTKIG